MIDTALRSSSLTGTNHAGYKEQVEKKELGLYHGQTHREGRTIDSKSMYLYVHKILASVLKWMTLNPEFSKRLISDVLYKK